MSTEENTNEVEVPETEAGISFDTFGLKREILQSIAYAGFKVASPIQAKAIPVILEGRDVVGQAHTGTGKTAAFGLPAMNNMHLKGGVEMLVITPTRELANQVSDELFQYGKKLGIRTVTVYGGSSYGRQIGLIERGAQVVIATPGRLMDILSRDMLPNFAPTTVILDEADEMLDMGFLDDINEIFTYLPQERQTLLFSATMPEPIKQLAKRILVNPEFISITKGETTNKDIAQQYYVINENERDDAIIRLLDSEETDKVIVFCRTKKEVDRLSNVLSSVGYGAKGLHGDMEQRQRETVIKGFKESAIDVLIATDVAARGIHVNNISHVINYHIPFDPESYVHRIGRTGRAGKSGQAITLVTPEEFKELQRIQKEVGAEMRLATIQGGSDLDDSGREYLAEQIRDIHIHNDAADMLEYMGDMDKTLLLEKLLSRLIGQEQNNVGSQIGFDQNTVDEMIQGYNGQQKATRNNNRRKKRR